MCPSPKLEDINKLITGIGREGDTEPDLYDNTDAERGSQAEDTGNAESQSDAIAVNKDQEPSPVRLYHTVHQLAC